MRLFDISNDRLGVLHGLTQDSSPPSSRPPVMPEVLNPPNSRPTAHSPPTGSDNGGGDSHTVIVENARGTEKPNKGKFRFKKERRPDREKRSRDHRHHHRHNHDSSSHQSKRPRRTYHVQEVKDDPAAYDDTCIPNAASFKYANSDVAFRESLFDAMADDEGAAFWEGVYGQPINIYSRPNVEGGRGKLEMMDDEQYARYVREKMWEKSHQHIAEERKEREREREARKERGRNEKAQKQQEQAERREREQKRERKAEDRSRRRWDEYVEKWAIITEAAQVGGKDSMRHQTSIPWPVKSGELSDITREAVLQFFLTIPVSTEYGSSDFTKILKLERVRWHPDKAQQWWGKDGISEKELKGITAVFQAIDSLWIENREKK